MRILFFNYEYPPLGGGAGNATYFLLKEFSKISGLKVDLVTSSFDNKKHIDNFGENIKIYQIPIGKTDNKKELHHQTKKDLILYTWRAFWFSRELLKENDYNLTHSFFSVPCGALSRFFLSSKNLPYIISLRGADVPGYSERFKIIYKPLLPVIKNIWKNSNQVVSNSLGLKELAAKNFPAEQITIIPNGIDIEEFNPKKFNPKKNKILKIVCVSRLTKRKSINTLIEAVEILKKRKIDIILEIVGDGEEKENLEILVKDKNLRKNVKFKGLIEHEKIAKFYAEADVFSLTSLNEGMSNTVLEAIAMGLPIITTNTGGTAELVKNKSNGFVVEKENPKQVADCIERLVKDEKLLRFMGEKSRERAEEMSWQRVAKQYFELYQQVAENKKDDEKV